MSSRTEPVARSRRSTAWRIFATVWLVYALHFASNVVRETYLAVSLGDSLSLRVDPYEGLHPDLFEIEDRGVYINNNPGASFLGAVPYALARPFMAGLFRLRPELARPKEGGTYEDPRPNRRAFFSEARARGVDIKLGLAAASMQFGLMAPLGAVSAVLVYLFLCARLRQPRHALWLALLFAFGTPMFFRSAFLNQNAIVAHATLFAFVAMADGGRCLGRRFSRTARWTLAGALSGLGILCDYSAAPLALAFGVWVVWDGWRGTAEDGVTAEGMPAERPPGPAGALHALLRFGLGAAGPLALLLAYQWAAFGHPLFPAQRYMPNTPLSIRGWNGITPPSAELLWGNLFDPRYGLFAFCPMLVAALAAPFIRRAGGPSRSELALIFGASLGLFLFASSVQFAALQFNTGIRYLVPAVPLLFLALVPVLRAIPFWGRALLVLPTLVVSWSVAMAREDVPTSLAHVLLGGLRLPWLTVLEKTSSAYAPFLDGRATPIPLFLVAGVALWALWRRVEPEDEPAGGPV